jgi:hypothetical protein
MACPLCSVLFSAQTAIPLNPPDEEVAKLRAALPPPKVKKVKRAVVQTPSTHSAVDPEKPNKRRRRDFTSS